MLSGFASRFLKLLVRELPNRRRPRRSRSVPAMIAMVEKLESRELLSGAGLVIVPTFDSTITSDPNHAKIEATINSVIAEYESLFSDHITVNITYAKLPSNDGETGTTSAFFDNVPYSQFLNALRTSQSTTNDTTALAHLPTASVEPVTGRALVSVNTANEKALGLINANDPRSDGTIYLNTDQSNLDRITIDPNKYDLKAIVAHETDHILGTGSGMDVGDGTGPIAPEDLFRYDQNGVRSYTTNASTLSYFSLDGTTKLVQFNQVNGSRGDWAASGIPRVQDAVGSKGVILDPSIELEVVDVLGYHFVAPVAKAPVGISKTVTTPQNTGYAFTPSDFGFSDPQNTPANTFVAVKITALPGQGTLTDNGTAVTTGQIVSVNDISGGKLIFTPANGGSGTPYASFTFQVQDDGSTANGGVNLDVTPKTMSININSVAHAPVGTSKTVTVLENKGYVFATTDFGFTDPQDTPSNTFTAVVIKTLPAKGTLTDNGAAVTVGKIVPVADISGGKLIFTPVANANGAAYASFTFQVQDNGSTANGGVNLDPTPKTMTINVTAVAQAPVGTSKTVTVLENKGYTFATTDFGFTDPHDTPANTFTGVMIKTLPAKGRLADNGVTVTVGQIVAVGDISGGKLIFTPAPNTNGAAYASFTFQVQDNGSTTNGGVNLDPTPKTMTINVTSVAQAPVGTSKTVSTPENQGYVFTVADFGFTDPLDTPANTFTAVKFTTVPGIGTFRDNGVGIVVGEFVSLANISDGKVIFTPATNGIGIPYTSFTFQVLDNGSTTNGGVNLDPTPKTMTINVIPPAHAPVGTSKTVTVLENKGYVFATTDFGFTDPQDTPANTFTAVVIKTLPVKGTLTDNGVAVLTVGQVVPVGDISGGRLIFTPAADANGAAYASFTFQVQDNGSTANGGVNLDPTPKTMTINVTAVAQAPVGTSKTVTVLENKGYVFATTDFGFTDPHDIPANTFTGVVIKTLPVKGTLVDNGIAVTLGQVVAIGDISGGKLIFTPAANTNGAAYASFTFQVQDNGSTANGGVNLDPTPKTMTINVTAVNQAPLGVSKTVTTVVSTDYVFNAADFGFTDPHDNPANALLSVKITTLPLVGTLTDNGTLIASAGVNISAVDIAAGKFKFTPVTNATGANYASFTFQVQDNGGTTNGGVDTDPAPKTITVTVLSFLNRAPVGTAKTVTTLEGAAYTFGVADFGFTDPNNSPPNALLAVKITTLPLIGSLTDNGAVVTVGQFVGVADITGGKLKFTPVTNGNGATYASFTFQVQDNGGTDNGGINIDATPRQMTVAVTSVNNAPVGTMGTVTTSKNTAYTFKTADFGFTDPNDTPPNALLAVKFSLLPNSGTLTDNGAPVTVNQFVSATDISGGKLVFTPTANLTGGPYFLAKFQVEDNGGTANGGINLDPTAKVIYVNITQVNSNTSHVNHAPVGTSGTITSPKNIAYIFKTTDFGFTDPGDNPANVLLAVKIVLLPNAGTLTDNGVPVTANQSISAADISGGKLVFTPKSNLTGVLFLCKFQVQDNGGTANGGADLDPTAKILSINLTA